MGLPTTITLNVGSPAADVVYDDVIKSGSSVQYSAPSPQGDIQGRRVLRVSHETTKAGVVRSLVRIEYPIFDSDSGTYKGLGSVNVVLARPGTAPVQLGKDLLESVAEFLGDTNRTTIASGIV